MLTREDLQRLSKLRLDDSVLLYKQKRYSSAYYLAGYSIELALKSCISKLFQAHIIPDKDLVKAIYTHKLSDLLKLSGLLPLYNEDSKKDPQFAAFWGIATKWTEESRYEFWDSFSAASLISAIKDPGHGVLQWMIKHW